MMAYWFGYSVKINVSQAHASPILLESHLFVQALKYDIIHTFGEITKILCKEWIF